MDEPKKIWIVAMLCLGLGAVTVATFWPVLHHEFINFDDPDYVTENDVVKGGLTADGFKWAFTTGHASNWHPVTWLSHMLDVQWFGMKPRGHHATNLFFHVANSILLLLLLWQMTGAVWRSASAAALFALHPLHAESVAWVAERKDVLSTFFGLLCLMAYAKYAQGNLQKAIDTSPCPLPGRGGEGEQRCPRLWYVAAFLLLALGLMSKPMLVTWPFVMLLLDFWPLQRVTHLRKASAQQTGYESEKENQVRTGNPATPHPTLSPTEAERARKTWQRLALEKLPFLALVVGSCIVTVLVQAKGGAVTTAINLPLGDRLENAVVSYGKYLGKMIWPADLAIFYPHPETRYPISDQWPWWAVVLTGMLLIGISIWFLRQGKAQPYLTTGWFWYLGTMVPVIGIVQAGTQAMADRYTYIPLIGIFIVVVWYLGDWGAKLSSGKLFLRLFAAATTAACVITSRTQLVHWRDSFSVFQQAVMVTRNNAPAHGNLGTEYLKRGDVDQAITHFKAALEADPHFADAAYSLGLLEQKRGNLEAAAAYYRDALQRRPDHVNAHHNLGAVLWLQGNPAEAEVQFREALRLKPDHLEANANLGNLLLELRRPSESQACLSTALQVKPDYLYARLALGLARKQQGQLIQAAEQLRQVIAQEPGNLEALLNLGVVLTDLDQTNEAATFLNQVTQAKPGLFQELALAGKALTDQGKPEVAVDQFKAAVSLKPDLAELREQLALSEAQAGRLDDAARNYELVLTQRPTAESYYYLAAIYGLQGKAAGAVTNFQAAIRSKPDYLAALNELAWILATHPDEKIRDGSEAVRLAERACKLAGDKEARYWGTLDAAYAEAGRFPEAIQTAEKTQALAREANMPELATAAATRLAWYRQNKPFHQ